MASKEIQEILKSRTLIFTLAVLDLKSRYRHSILGIGWSFLEPLLILTILNAVFSNILKNNIENFPIFLILGLTLFNMFIRSTSAATESILGRSHIIKSVYLRREIFPIASVITAFLMMLIEFSIVIIFVLIFQFSPTFTVLFLPIPIFLLFILAVGMALPLSVMNIHYRDIRVIWTVVAQGLFFLTPIFYQINFLPSPISDLVRLSPLALLVEMSQNALLFNKLPSYENLIYVTITSFSILILGWLIFRKLNKTVDEII
jgi:ABC-type polysaccharide/polyol phosphate export permease